jgi:predicted nucleic acid-binding protein
VQTVGDEPAIVVADASVVIEGLAGQQGSTIRRRLARHAVHCPHHIDAEVGDVLRRWTAAGRIEPVRAQRALGAIDSIVDQRYALGPLSTIAWTMRDDLSYCDALYVSLAAALRVPLLTADKGLAGAPDLPCAVEVV